MQDQRLKTLGDIVAQACDEVRKVSSNREVLLSAIRELAVNTMSVINYLKSAEREGFAINDDLSPREDIYESLTNDRLVYRYREICNRMMYHLTAIREVPKKVASEGEDYLPTLAEYF